MQPILSTLGDLAHKARQARDVVRGHLRRLHDAYLERRGGTETSSSARAADANAGGASVADAPNATPEKNWELSSQADLVDHIVAHYHAGLRRDLPTLIAAARQLEREHASHPAVPGGLTDLLAAFGDELESHMTKEESMLFPTLRSGARGGETDMPMRMMEREHESHNDQLVQIRELTNDFDPPADAGASWTSLYAGLATLDADLDEHIYLENNILFRRATGGR